MRSPILLLPLSLAAALPLALGACAESGSTAAGEAGAAEAPEEPAAGDPMAALRANVAETAARSEVDAESVRVAHILVAFKDAARATVTRSKEEAEQRAAELLARIEAGEDFMVVMKGNSDDPGEGVYSMTTGTPKGMVFPRSGMAKAFGDTSWRLEVGDVGVAAYDPAVCPFGWHIITRLE